MITKTVVTICLLISTVMSQTHDSPSDTNFLTGANDVIVVKQDDGTMSSTPFSLIFGKSDIFLPRKGHQVKVLVNDNEVEIKMELDDQGRAVFDSSKSDKLNSEQLKLLGLNSGQNTVEYQVEAMLGGLVTTKATIYLLNNHHKIVVSDIDGTITKSNFGGLVMPTLGISEWKHNGIVKLFNMIRDRGYTLLYLTSRGVGMSESTREYLFDLQEIGGNRKMPNGPVLFGVNSILDSLRIELIDQNPEQQKIQKLKQVQALFKSDPLYAGYGNQDSDAIAYKAVGLDVNKIYDLDEDSSIKNLGDCALHTLEEHIKNVSKLYPNL